MAVKDITSIRGTIEFLKERNELLVVKKEVDLIYEMSAIHKAFENGPALFFENIKGYPNIKNLGNLFSRVDRAAAIFDVPDPRKLKFKLLDAIRKPIPPKVVEQAPCQEVVITDNIDVLATLPIPKHSEDDVGRIAGGGVVVVNGLWDGKGSSLSFRRLYFRGKDWGTLNVWPGSHLNLAIKQQRQRIPITICYGVAPAVMIRAASTISNQIMPSAEADQLAGAGAFQGSPIEICQAKTVDAYAIANAEWVVEGYLSSKFIWETEEAERIGKEGVAPFYPEWHGYLGRAIRAPKLEVTAITHRKDRPIFYTSLADSLDANHLVAFAPMGCDYALADRLAPGLVVDANRPSCLVAISGVVFQVKKRGIEDDGWVKNILLNALAQGAGIAIAVDEHVDIYNADDLLWGITTTALHERGMFWSPQGSISATGWAPVPASMAAKKRGELSDGGLAIDATIPFAARGQFKRAHYPVDKIELSKWFSEAEIATVRSLQSDWGKLLARIGG